MPLAQPLIDISLWSKFTRRIMAVLLTAGLLVGGLLTLLAILQQKNQWEDSLRLRSQTLVRSLGRASFVPLVLEDTAALNKLADGFKEEMDVAYVAFYTSKGKLLIQKPKEVQLPPLPDEKTNSTEVSVKRIKFPGKGPILDSALALRYGSSELSGIVRIGMSEKRIQKEIQTVIGKNVALSLGVMLVAFVAGAFLIQRMSRQMLEFIEQVQMMAELKRTNEELEAFSYSVSHDLRAPLRSIDGFSQVVIEDYGDRLGKEGKDTLERVRAGCRRMGQLIDDLLGLSRVIRREMKMEQVNLSLIARAVMDQLTSTDSGRPVELVIPDNVTTNGDPGLLRIVLENLLGNSWKFTQKKSSAHIEFGVIQKEKEKIYFVRDNGAGFDMTYANKLFGAFQRLHDTSEFPGTGIGLATVQRVIHRHGGRIWAEAVVGQGATFYFTLRL